MFVGDPGRDAFSIGDTMVVKRSQLMSVSGRPVVEYEREQGELKSPAREWIELEVVDKRPLMNRRNRGDAGTKSSGKPGFTGNGWVRTSSTGTAMV